MFRVAKYALFAIVVSALGVAILHSVESTRREARKLEMSLPARWVGKTFLPSQWDADFCGKQHSKNQTCVIGQPEKVATLCTELSTARTWPHVTLDLAIPDEGELRDHFREVRLETLTNVSWHQSGGRGASASGGPYYIVPDTSSPKLHPDPHLSSSSSSGALNPKRRTSRYDNSSGSSSSSAWVHIKPLPTYGTFFDMIVASDLRSFGTNEDVHRFLRTLFLDRGIYSYDSGDWTAKALARRGFEAGDQITVSIPLSPATRNHLEKLRSGTKTSEGLFDPLSPIMIQLDNAQKIQDEIIGCPQSDKSIGVSNFDVAEFSGSWARWSSGPIEPKLKSVSCGNRNGTFFVTDDSGRASTWRVHNKRGSQLIRHEKVRVEPPYVHIQSDGAEIHSIAVHVGEDMIVLKEMLGENSGQLNRYIWLQRCEESFDEAVRIEREPRRL